MILRSLGTSKSLSDVSKFTQLVSRKLSALIPSFMFFLLSSQMTGRKLHQDKTAPSSSLPDGCPSRKLLSLLHENLLCIPFSLSRSPNEAKAAGRMGSWNSESLPL